MLRLILGVLIGTLAHAQTVVNQTEGPPPIGYQAVYTISSNLVSAICYAQSVVTTGSRSRTTVSISAVSKANPGVVTSTGHGFAISSRPAVTISGATGTGWITGINGAFVATVIDANTFSVPVDTSGFGTLAGTVVFTTTAPRSTMYEWAVEKLAYDASNNLIWKGWLYGSTGFLARCSDASSTSVQQQ